MKKILSLFAAVLFAGSMMADNYVLVTDASTLADGDQIIITDVDAAAAISTLQKSNNRGVTTVALTDGVIVPGENVQIITLVAANANFMLKVGEDAYLYAASNSSNHLKTANAETVGDNGKFAISITSGVASVTAQGTNSRNDLRYNPSSSCFSCYGSSSSIEAGLKIFKKGGAPTPTTKYYLVGSMNEWKGGDAYKFKANPAADGEYMLDLKLAAGNASMKVIGVLEADTTWYPAGVGNDFVINDAGRYTIYFRPAGGQEGWHAGYIYAQNHPLITCAAAAALAKDEVAYLNEVVVTYVNGGNTYVKDASGYELIYEYNFGLVAGDTVNGFIGKSSPYNGLPELKPAGVTLADLDVVPGEAPAPEEITAAPTAADVNKYLVIKGVSVNGEFTTASATNLNATIGEETFVLRNNFKIAQTFSAEKKYDIVGVGAIYVKDETTTLQLYFISATESTSTGLDNTAVEVKAIKTIENGQLVIIKNGIRYDATGAVMR